MMWLELLAAFAVGVSVGLLWPIRSRESFTHDEAMPAQTATTRDVAVPGAHRHITCILMDGAREMSRKQLQGTFAPDVIRQPHGREPVLIFSRATQTAPDVWTYRRVT